MTVKKLKKFDRYCLTPPQKTVIFLSRSMSPDRMKKERVIDDLQYLHHQQQLKEQDYEQLLADGLLLPQMRTQTDNSNQTSMGEEK